MLDAGSLNRRITIQRPADPPVTDDFGNPVESWENMTTVWAKVDYVRDSERFSASQINAVVTARFTIRWGLNLTPLHRILYKGKEYDIIGIKEIGLQEGQEISASSDADYAPGP